MLDHIKTFLAQDPIVASFTAKSLIFFLERFSDGDHIDFYGCGSFSQALVNNHAKELSRLNIRFIQTEVSGTMDFHGFSLLSVKDAAKTPAKAIILLSHSYDSAMRKALKEYSGEILGIKEALNLTDISALIPEIKSIISTPVTTFAKSVLPLTKNRPVILFVTECPALHTFKLMSEICKQGYSIILYSKRGNLTETIHVDQFKDDKYFDLHYTSVGISPYELEIITKIVKPQLIHAEIGMWPPFLLAECITNWEVPVVVDYRDVEEVVFTDTDQACKYKKINPSQYAIEEKAREVIYKKASGIILKESENVSKFLQDKYNHTPKHQLQYFQYIIGDKILPKPPETSNLGIVYAGNICADPEWHSYPQYVALLNAAKTITAQRLHFTIYNSEDSTGEGYEDFLNLSKENNYFHYKFAVPYQQLIPELSQYDYGYFCLDYTNSYVESPFFIKETLGSKVFTYLEAGLPVIVSKEIGFMAEILNKMGLAIPYLYTELATLKKHLSLIDRDSMLKDIDKTRSKWTHKNNIHKLNKFYDEIINDFNHIQH